MCQGINRSSLLWNDEVQWTLKMCKGRSAGAGIYRIILAVTLYYLWQERKEPNEDSRNYCLIDHSGDLFSSERIPKLATYIQELNYYLVQNVNPTKYEQLVGVRQQKALLRHQSNVIFCVVIWSCKNLTILIYIKYDNLTPQKRIQKSVNTIRIVLQQNPYPTIIITFII